MDKYYERLANEPYPSHIKEAWLRWFVLNEDVLCYYTSKEKMRRGQQRGAIRLRGAAIGIDGENHSLFTITVDGKVFHLQGRDQCERDAWVHQLERIIHDTTGIYKLKDEDPLTDLNKRVAHAESQSHDLLEQVRRLEGLESGMEARRKRLLAEVLLTARRLQGTVDHSILVLKKVESKFSSSLADKGEGSNKQDTSTMSVGDQSETREIDVESIGQEPPISYSSSEDEEFFDAHSSKTENGSGAEEGEHKKSQHLKFSSIYQHREYKRGSHERGLHNQEEPNYGDADENFDQIYENHEESDLGNVQQQHGSVLMHLLSQVSVGMDLTRVTLPTFILERRSLLEMYADFFAHPDDFISGVDLPTPEGRFMSIVRYYLNSIYPARKSGVAKKPYNPILGEIFRCRWTIPGAQAVGKVTQAGPFPGSDINQVTFIAEQVSHHPPVSAFYAEHPAKEISFTAHIWTKSSFLGLSIGVANIGQGCVRLLKHDEAYIVTFPNGYGRSIMSTPWIELGGKVEVKCEKTGYSAEIEFITKPFFGGKPHKIAGTIYRNWRKEKIATLRGEWNGEIYIKREGEEERLLSDVRTKPDVRKECTPVAKQGERESRNLWKHVTAALFHNKINIASASKRWIEQRQRDETRSRLEKGIKWNCKYFEHDPATNCWVYKEALEKRRQTQQDIDSV